MTETTRNDIPIVLLAAGQSSRMRGADKLAEKVDGVPLLTRQARVARAATSAPVIVTLPATPHPRYRMLDGIDVNALPVPDAADGMSRSLRAGLGALPRGAPAAMILLADLPELETDDLRCVLAAVATDPHAFVWRGATQDGKPGHPLVISRQLFPEMMALDGDNGGRDVLRRALDKTRLVPLRGQRARRDLDTPEDWAAWRATRD